MTCKQRAVAELSTHQISRYPIEAQQKAQYQYKNNGVRLRALESNIANTNKDLQPPDFTQTCLGNTMEKRACSINSAERTRYPLVND